MDFLIAPEVVMHPHPHQLLQTKEKLSQLLRPFMPCSRCGLIFSVAMIPFFPGAVLVKAFNVRESRGHWWTDIVVSCSLGVCVCGGGGYVDTVWFHD